VKYEECSQNNWNVKEDLECLPSSGFSTAKESLTNDVARASLGI